MTYKLANENFIISDIEIEVIEKIINAKRFDFSFTKNKNEISFGKLNYETGVLTEGFCAFNELISKIGNLADYNLPDNDLDALQIFLDRFKKQQRMSSIIYNSICFMEECDMNIHDICNYLGMNCNEYYKFSN